MPNIAQAPGTNHNLEFLSPQFKTLSYQPAVRGDYQINSNLRMTAKYTGQKGFRGLTPGTIPGFNDTYNAYPWVHAIATTVDYALNPSTFIEATYGFSNRRLGQITATGATNRFDSGLGALPQLYPNANILPGRLVQLVGDGRRRAAVFRQRPCGTRPDLHVGQSHWRPAAEPGVSGISEHEPHAGRVDQRDEAARAPHDEDGVLQQPQPQAAEPEPAQRAAVPGTARLRQRHEQSARHGIRLRECGRRRLHRPTRSSRPSWKASSSTTRSKATSRTTGA